MFYGDAVHLQVIHIGTEEALTVEGEVLGQFMHLGDELLVGEVLPLWQNFHVGVDAENFVELCEELVKPFRVGFFSKLVEITVNQIQGLLERTLHIGQHIVHDTQEFAIYLVLHVFQMDIHRHCHGGGSTVHLRRNVGCMGSPHPKTAVVCGRQQDDISTF